jgi:hypothetical protein
VKVTKREHLKAYVILTNKQQKGAIYGVALFARDVPGPRVQTRSTNFIQNSPILGLRCTFLSL